MCYATLPSPPPITPPHLGEIERRFGPPAPLRPPPPVEPADKDGLRRASSASRFASAATIRPRLSENISINLDLDLFPGTAEKNAAEREVQSGSKTAWMRRCKKRVEGRERDTTQQSTLPKRMVSRSCSSDRAWGSTCSASAADKRLLIDEDNLSCGRRGQQTSREQLASLLLGTVLLATFLSFSRFRLSLVVLRLFPLSCSSFLGVRAVTRVFA